MSLRLAYLAVLRVFALLTLLARSDRAKDAQARSSNRAPQVVACEAGVLKRWRATPLPRWGYFLGRITATVIVATLAGAATVAVGVLPYRTNLTTQAALGALAAFILGAFA